MSFSSGTFTINSTGQPVVTGTTISSTVFNAFTADIASGLSTCLLKDGTQTLTANIPFGNFKITGLGNGTALTDAANFGQIQSGSSNYLTAVAGTNTVTATATPTVTLAVGNRFWLIPAATNTTAVTLQIGANAAGAVQLNGAALIGGEMTINVPIEVIVTAATPVFEIIGDGGFLNKNQTQLTKTFLAAPATISGASSFRVIVASDLSGALSPLTNSLTVDVTMTQTALYFDGPSIAQGTAGTWLVEGTISLLDANGGGGNVFAKLWDGTTVIASGIGIANSLSSIALSGWITNPAGNLRISARNTNNAANAFIKFNQTGLSKDSTISAIRIA